MLPSLHLGLDCATSNCLISDPEEHRVLTSAVELLYRSAFQKDLRTLRAGNVQDTVWHGMSAEWAEHSRFDAAVKALGRGASKLKIGIVRSARKRMWILIAITQKQIDLVQ